VADEKKRWTKILKKNEQARDHGRRKKGLRAIQ
jgi:hypothetical protein